MKTYIIIALTLILAMTNTQSFGQSDIHLTQREIGVQYGISFSKVKDDRLSARTKNINLRQFAVIYNKINKNRMQNYKWSFSANFKNPNKDNLWYKIIHPEFTYSYQTKYKDQWIGGYFNHFTILNFPKSLIGGFGNNPISYTIGNSLGVAYTKTYQLQKTENSVFDMHASAKLALLNHIIRPAYGHPYPENYLNENEFSPTRQGLGKSIAKSGKITTLNKTQNFRIVVGFNYYYKVNMKLNASLTLGYQNQNSHQQSSLLTKDVLIGLSYIY